jgi:hypothetical protein
VRFWPATALLLFALAFQVLALPLYRLGDALPDFPFLALAYLGLFARPRQVLAAAAVVAVAIDAVSLDPLGTHLVGYLPALWLLNRVRGGFIAGSVILRGAFTLAAAWAAFLLQGAFLASREGRWPSAGLELRSALYTAALGVIVHAALDRYRTGLGWVRDRF